MGNKALRAWQIGIENDFGVAVAATRRFYPGPGSVLEKDFAFHTPEVDAASYDAARHGRHRQLARVGGSLPDIPLDTNMIIEFFRMAISSTPSAGTQIGSTGAYDWVFNPGDTLASGTVEWDASGQIWRETGAMFDEWSIKWAVGEPALFSGTLIGRDKEKSTLTAALSHFTVAPIQGWEVGLYIDAIGGTAFTTQKTLTLIGGEITGRNNLTRRYFDDNTQLLGAIGRGKREVEATLTLDLGANGMTEWDAWAAGTERLVGIRFGGNRQAGSDAANKHKIDVTLPGVWTAQKVGDDEEASTLDLTLSNVYNTTLGHAFRVAVVNTRAA